jgi:alkylated DNA repair dioxygenase AlkB
MYNDTTLITPDTKPFIEPWDQGETIELTDGGRLRYWRQFLGLDFADRLYHWIRDAMPWEEVRFHGRPAPRLTVCMTSLTCRYGGAIRKSPPQVELVRRLAVMVEQMVIVNDPQSFSSVLLDYYRTGLDRMERHAERGSDLRPGAPLAILSLGTTRRFVLQHNHSDERYILSLGAGSLLVMEGSTQTHWQHEFPSEPQCTGGMISLTMRSRAVS